MRRIFLVAAILVPLGGCASLAEGVLNLPTGILTASVANPVTPGMLSEVENGASVAFAALNTYRTTCKNQILADNRLRAEGQTVAPRHCRVLVAKLQTYTRKIPPLLAQLRGFVRKNDQVNAHVVFDQVKALIANVRSFATDTGAGQ